MCSKRIESYNRPVTPDIESVGQFYIKMLKGYVGISTVVSYTVILFEIFKTSTDISLTVLMVFVDPIVIIMIFTLISLVFEMRANNLNVRVNKNLEKLNIDITPKTIKIE
jgi:ABC-type multidrug transport system fused ATPase/permease subunit